MAEYVRPEPELDFSCTGMSLRPVDKLAPGKFQFLKNVRITAQGRIDSRPGSTPLSTTPFDQTNVHSIRRLNDYVPGASPTSVRVVGAGTKLYLDTSGTAIDTGYSGNPLSMVPYRPDQSIDSAMYVADSNKMSKVKTNGTLKSWGLAQPTTAPGAEIQVASPGFNGRQSANVTTGSAESIEDGSTTGFANGGTAGTIGSAVRIPLRQMGVVQPYVFAVNTPTKSMWALVLGAQGSGTTYTPSSGVSQSASITQTGNGGSTGYSLNISGFPSVILAGLSATVTLQINADVLQLSGVGGGGNAQWDISIDSGSTWLTGFSWGSSAGGTPLASQPVTFAVPSGCTNLNTVEIRIQVTAGTSSSSSVQTNANITNCFATVAAGLTYAAGYSGIQAGSLIEILYGPNSGSLTFLCDALVEQVFNGNPPGTILGIIYDAGTSGPCTIVVTGLGSQLAGDSAEFVASSLGMRVNGVGPGSIVQLNFGGGNTEEIQVLDVINGPDGSACIRCSTANTHSIGESISFAATLIVSSPLSLVVGSQLIWGQGNALSSALTAGEGTISSSALFTANNFGVNGFAFKQQDYIFIMAYMDNPQNMVDFTVYLDVDVDGNNDFAHNAFYFVLTANDLVDPSLQGEAQWQMYSFRLADMLRIGSDPAASLNTIYGVRFTVDCIGTLNIAVSSTMLVGGGNIDVGTSINDYYYRYRGRNLDGATTNWSPPSRNGLHLVRNVGLVQIPGSPPWDKVDVSRFGGALDAFTYVGTCDATTAWLLTDNLADESVLSNPQAQLDDFQPFPDSDASYSGVCNVIGNKIVWVSGATFKTSWGAGTEIIIAGIVYNLYTSPVSTILLEIVQNGTYQLSVAFQLPQPILLANPLPSVWGPTDDTGTIFACGSQYQPGVVFWTNGNAPDNASDKNQLELTSPSQPLLNGCLNAGRSIVAAVKSKDKASWWAMYPQLNSPQQYQPVELQIGRALWNRTGLATDGSIIWFISEDGIYMTALSAAQSITDEDMRDLFPHDNEVGRSVSVGGGITIYPPNMTLPMQLNYNNGLLFFDYQDSNGDFATLVYDIRIGGWVSYETYPVGCNLHYGEEGQGINSILLGGIDGHLYQFGGTYDAAGAAPGTQLAIAGQINPPAFDGGDFRNDKKWGDLVADYNATGAATGIVLTPQFNDYAVAPIAATTLGPTSGRVMSFPVDLAQSLYRNLAPLITWAEKVLIRLYGWQPSYISQPENTALRITDWTNAGYPGAKFVQGLILEADTANVALSINIQGDAGAVGANISVQHNGQTEIAYSFVPFVAHLLRLAQITANSLWKFYAVRWVFEPMPELAVNWTTQPTTHDLSGFMHVRELQIALMSTSTVTITIQADNVALPAITIPSTGGAYQKVHLLLPPNPNKAKSYIYSFTSTVGFRLFKRDIEVKVKQWGSTGGYIPFNPFGGQSRADGAAI